MPPKSCEGVSAAARARNAKMSTGSCTASTSVPVFSSRNSKCEDTTQNYRLTDLSPPFQHTVGMAQLLSYLFTAKEIRQTPVKNGKQPTKNNTTHVSTPILVNPMTLEKKRSISVAEW